MEPRTLTPEEVERWKAHMQEMRKLMPDDDPNMEAVAMHLDTMARKYERMIRNRDIALIVLAVCIVAVVVL